MGKNLRSRVLSAAAGIGPKSRGTPTRALEKAMAEDAIASCGEIEAEIFRVPVERFSWESAQAQRALELVLARAIHVQLRGSVKECRDPHDDMFLECAMRANADLLVAGDKDLLVLGSYKGTRILTPAEYIQSWHRKSAPTLRELREGWGTQTKPRERNPSFI